MKSLLPFLLLLGCTATLFRPAAFAQESGTKVSRPGIFSYQAPPGWRVLTLAKIENPIATDPAQRETKPYIEVDTVTSAKPLVDFTESNKQSMKAMVPSTKFVEQGPFVTTAGTQGVRIVATARVGDQDQKAIYYLFDGPMNTKVIMFANVTAAGFQRNALAFDAAAKTLELSR